jgi:hypothetical protein
MRRQAFDPFTLEDDAARGWTQQPGDRINKGCLSGSIRAYQGNDLSLVDLQTDIPQSLDLPVAGVYITNFKHFLLS